MSVKKTTVLWSTILAIILLLTVFSSFIAPYPPNEMDMAKVYLPPNADHWLGTDHLGRDVLSRMLHGGKVTLTVAFGSVAISLVIGILYGGVSGYAGRFVDSVMMRLLEAFLTIPTLVIVIAFQAVVSGGVLGMTLLIGLTSWFTTARIVRSEFIRLKETDYVKMAKMFGTPTHKIITGHLLRNSIPPIFVVTIFNLAGAVFIEVSLSFLGIGVPPAIPSWGTMLYNAQNDLLIGAWWIGVFVGLVIFITILSINFIGEALKDRKGRRYDA